VLDQELRHSRQNLPDISSVDIVAFAKQKLDEGVEPSTVGNYISHLASVFSIARPAWGYELNQQAMEARGRFSRRSSNASAGPASTSWTSR
jgi:hypothetical protein